jgi:hypothetical protein
MGGVVTDEIAARRATIAKAARRATRVGYLALAVATVAFFVGFASGFPRWTVVTSVAALVAGCVILPVPIVVGYGVRAAAREDSGPRTARR